MKQPRTFYISIVSIELNLCLKKVAESPEYQHIDLSHENPDYMFLVSLWLIQTEHVQIYAYKRASQGLKCE